MLGLSASSKWRSTRLQDAVKLECERAMASPVPTLIPHLLHVESAEDAPTSPTYIDILTHMQFMKNNVRM